MNQEDMSDIINKFTSSMNNSGNSENTGNSSISPEMISNLMNMFKNNQNKKEEETNADSSASSSSSAPQIDMETLLKMKKLFEQINKKDDPRAKLLLSLKPYLKESRKSKLEQYVQLLNMSKIIEVFNKPSGGDSAK